MYLSLYKYLFDLIIKYTTLNEDKVVRKKTLGAQRKNSLTMKIRILVCIKTSKIC